MVSIVAEEHQAGRFNLKVETAVNAMIGLYAVTQLFGIASVKLCHSHSRNGVLDVDGHGMAQGYMLDVLDGRNKVERNVAIVYLHVLGVEVACIECVFVHLHPRFYIGFKLHSFFNNECAALANEGCVMAKALHVGLFGAVDVEVVGVGRGDYAHPRTKPMEGTVELVGLDNHVFAFGTQYIIGAIVFGYASKEGVTVGMTLVHDVRTHARSGCFAVRSGETKPF